MLLQFSVSFEGLKLKCKILVERELARQVFGFLIFVFGFA